VALKDLVQAIAAELVDQPDKLVITELSGGDSSVVELRAAREDLGKIIGKEGRTADSIRTLLIAAATKTGKRVQLNIVNEAERSGGSVGSSRRSGEGSRRPR
jgi:predicted RNA-binding protein YlqC (UPF0109 family)